MGNERLDANEVEQLKHSILEQWGRLPPEEAAAVMVEQLREFINGEAGGPVRQLLGLEKGDWLDKPFPVVSITPADLKRVHLSEEDIGQLDESDMGRVASILRDAYLGTSFWSDLSFAAEKMLEEKVQSR